MTFFDWKKEVWLWLILFVPISYLAYIWPTLPEIIPTHFGFDGKPDDWSHRSMYAFLIPGLNIGIYLLMTFIPYIDARKKHDRSGNSYFLLKLFTTVFVAFICMLIVRSSVTGLAGI